MHLELFDARMLSPLLQFLDEQGARSEAYLDRVRIPGELIRAGGWITKKQAYDFTYDIVQRTGHREAVYAAYLNFAFSHLGPVATAMQACKTVKESLEVGLRLGSVAYEGNEYFLEIDGETTWICYRERRNISPGLDYINDMTLIVYYQLVQGLIDESWQPEQIRLREKLNERHRLVAPFENCRATVDNHLTALAIPTRFLSRPIPSRIEQADESNAQWRFGPDGMEPTAERLYRLLASQFTCQSFPTLEQLARLTSVSSSTLKRHLSASGITYRGLLDRLRYDEACQMLQQPEFAIKEIAYELGYSGTNNFTRSFRRMTGITPGAYRRKHHD